jgi:DNA repair photolyase
MEHPSQRRPRQAVRHILLHEEARSRFPERVAAVLRHFPDIEPELTAELNDEIVNRYIKDVFPNTEVKRRAQTEVKSTTEVRAGKRILVIGEAAEERRVEKFIDTKGMACHGFFHINVMVNGCVFNCQYCFLQQHIWDKDVSSFIKLNVNYEDIVARMKEIAGQRLARGLATRFHTGILLDYLCFEDVTRFTEFLVSQMGDDAFARSTVDMWSKGDDVRSLLDAAAKYPWATERILPGWSVNSPYAAETYEPGTAGTRQRLQAARELQDVGYRLTIRLDPMVPYPAWKTDYPELVDMVFGEFGLRPDVVFVSSLRFDEPELIEVGRERFPNSDLFCHDFPKEDRAKYRLPFDLRIEMLRTVVERIQHHDQDQIVGICKENIKTWKALGLNPALSCLSEPVLETTMDKFVLD